MGTSKSNNDFVCRPLLRPLSLELTQLATSAALTVSRTPRL